MIDQLLAHLQHRVSLSRLEETVIRKLVRRLHQDCDGHDQVARVREEVVPDASTVTTGLELTRVDASPMGKDVPAETDKFTGPKAVRHNAKTHHSPQAAAVSRKTIKPEHDRQNPNPSGKSVPLSEYVEGVEIEPYQFGMKHMKKHGWALGQGLGPLGSGICEFLQPVPNAEHSKENNPAGKRSGEAPTVDKDRSQQRSRGSIHKDTVAMPDGKRYDVTSTLKRAPNASAEYGETEWQSGFPHDDPYLKKFSPKHASWAKNGW